ncbi:hypothetical protein GGI21_002940 [Coemansia aciculifera]|nr:hypothetical protein GGI21_002940 [Coemansia aciculifera]
MSNHHRQQSASKRGTTHETFSAPTLQVPHMAKMAPTATTAESTKTPVDSSLHSGGILRAQLKGPVSLPALYANGGTALSSQTTHTGELARSPQLGGGGGGGSMSAKRVPPWDEALTTFLSQLCSPRKFGLESLAVWHDEMAKLTIPSDQTRQVERAECHYVLAKYEC